MTGSPVSNEARHRRRLLVIGHGMVGNKVVEALVRRGATRSWDLVVVGEEALAAYDRVHLSKLFEGADSSDLDLVDPEIMRDPALTLVRGEQVVHLDRARRVATTDRGREFPYDAAVMATGSSAFVPPVAGRDLPGCFVYRSVTDVDAIRRWANGRAHGVVVGGGLLGLEAANALRHCGLATEVVEIAPRLMPLQVDEIGGDLLRRRIEDHGLAVHTATALVSIVAGEDGTVSAVELAPAEDRARSELLTTEMVVFAAGIRPRDELARGCGLEVGERGGIVVDERCRTSDPSIYAVGECALAGGRVHGLVSPGYQMARVAAENICGGDSVFEPGETPTKLKLLGVDVASFGDAHARTAGASTIAFTDNVSRVHRRLVTASDGRVIGGILVGDASGFDTMVAVTAGDADAPEDFVDLLLPGRRGDDHAPAAAAGPALRPSATVCSCENVSAGQICDSIAESIRSSGQADLAAVKSSTGAGTGCGGCVPQITDLLRARLAEAGIEASRRLCEHFSQSRQELCDIVRLTAITTFSELIGRYGTGAGCETCKPAVASILASVSGGHILDGEGASIQDSNDHFLANLQRDGTYSVVPRVPGGELTPEKLIVLGEVAQAFNLYVKITGGQRIDLLGARVDDLPAIWARLADAGLESGHAYGKAVRTVKSCVGSTWCRYGVQDSTGLAVELELRYRGLRSPHKIKMAVSGCVRECAEAQGKDVGVIATERGWNLYVCGNGGARPRHADLLAADLDKDTLVRYIDRFVMYYVRTADRLQRSSTWLEAMEGGIDHLRRVVVEDSLGLAADLEAAMAEHVARYRCEWRETLEDPIRLRRFRSFVNADVADPDIVMTEERGQPRPAFEWERVELLASPK
ncbi:MAG: nitrite reductase large subunit [Acidimicrobiales bacterium]|nr:nitrite reductase large subunit [Acidimicrobiales bacterium]